MEPKNGCRGPEVIQKDGFPVDIDYILCTRGAGTENIGEWTLQSPIPENLWDRQSVLGEKRSD
jgi:hypothetical protein